MPPAAIRNTTFVAALALSAYDRPLDDLQERADALAQAGAELSARLSPEVP